MTRLDDRARDRRKLPPADAAERGQWIAACLGVPRERRVDHGRLAREPVGIDTGPRPYPGRTVAAKKRRRERGCGGGVADSHLAEAEQVRTAIDRSHARLQHCDAVCLAERRRLRHVLGGRVEIERHYRQFGAQHVAELVDRGTARLEVGHHLRRDRRGIG